MLIREIADAYGSQCVVVAIDTDLVVDEWMVFIHGGRVVTSKDTLTWAREVAELGAGEILLTTMQRDGTRAGFALDITSQVAEAVNIPVIASGGAGSMGDFNNLFTSTSASAALAASVFHFGEIAIPDLKRFMIKQDIPVRL